MGITILLVEDDQDSRGIYRDALVERGHTVVIASQGAEGVHMARRQHPDLILLDIRMPVMDGYDAIRYLKSDEVTAHIPVWGISAYFPDEEEENGVLKMFDRIIRKPIAPNELIAEIDSWLRPVSPQLPS